MGDYGLIRDGLDGDRGGIGVIIQSLSSGMFYFLFLDLLVLNIVPLRSQSIIFMAESQTEYFESQHQRQSHFNSPPNAKNSKFSHGEERTNYKRSDEETPAKNNEEFARSSYRKEEYGNNTNTRSKYEDRRSSSAERNRQNEKDESDETLDKIEAEIKSIGERLRSIHLETIGKEPGALDEEKRDLKKRLIDLDYDHKILCAQKKVYGRDGPLGTSTYTFSPSKQSSRVRLAEIETELSLIRSRRLLDLEKDIFLYDYYLDYPYYSYLYRPLRYYSSYLYDYAYYPRYRSLWWL